MSISRSLSRALRFVAPQLGTLPVLLGSLLWVGCRENEAIAKKTHASAADSTTANAAAPTPLPTGLNEDELQKFYHLSEGSEFVPYCVLKVFAKERGQTLAQFFDTYHLIPDKQGDEHNPLGLPIGLTLSKEKSFELIGFTCAACHVGRITTDVPHTIVGAPGNFNIRQFYDDLLPWMDDNLIKTPTSARRKVLGCMALDMLKGPKGTKKSAEESDDDSLTEEMHAANGARDARASAELYQHLEAAAEKPDNSAAAAAELDKASASAAGASRKFKLFSRERRRATLERWRTRYQKAKSLILAYKDSLPNTLAVGKIEKTTLPGPGRVDAFMTAFNLMNPGAKLNMDSPVAFPPLWGLDHVSWLHYDGNTTAKLQRNMGQAVGVGALLGHPDGDPIKIIATSVNIESLGQLEKLVGKIQPPRWPFERPDSELVAHGAKVYREECARCHEPLPSGFMPEPSSDPKDAPNTDSLRLSNFERTDPIIAKNWPDKTLIEVLAATLAAVENASGASAAQRDQDPRWRAPGRYAYRPLSGVWASAPYLHNNSVPTLADLLKPSDERPKQFTLDYAHYDREDVGFEQLAEPGGLGSKPCAGAQSERFDTTLAGNGNRGHEFGTLLSAEDKQALLAYLKQL